ncbi:hypothetical protein B0H10DRAFT_1195803 [Mycena sp. CBHHK59/15]|nr:hypothetical protein B0H10DRAFT_1195803 [Mycena sp. CBHHK59/15]
MYHICCVTYFLPLLSRGARTNRTTGTFWPPRGPTDWPDSKYIPALYAKQRLWNIHLPKGLPVRSRLNVLNYQVLVPWFLKVTLYYTGGSQYSTCVFEYMWRTSDCIFAIPVGYISCDWWIYCANLHREISELNCVFQGPRSFTSFSRGVAIAAFAVASQTLRSLRSSLSQSEVCGADPPEILSNESFLFPYL